MVCGVSRSQDTLTVAGSGLSLRVSLIIPLIIAHAPISMGMQRAIADRLVDNNLTVTYFDIEQALGVATDPRLEMDRRALAPEIR